MAVTGWPPGSGRRTALRGWGARSGGRGRGGRGRRGGHRRGRATARTRRRSPRRRGARRAPRRRRSRSGRTSSSPSVKRTRLRPPRSSTMAAGGPSATTRPRSSTTMRSQSRSASSTSWVTSMTVVPAARTWRTTSQMCRRPTGSRFWVSSSRNTSSGRPTRARATKSRWRSPPDSAPKGRRHSSLELPLLGQLVQRLGVGVQRREQPQRLADPHAVGEGGVLELRADAAAQAVAAGWTGRAPAPRPSRCWPGAGPGGSRRRWSCRRRWCRGGRRARPARR